MVTATQHHLRDVIEEEMAETVRVTVIATGFDGAQASEALKSRIVAQLRPYNPKPAPPKAPAENVPFLRRGSEEGRERAQLPLDDLSRSARHPDFLRASGLAPGR